MNNFLNNIGTLIVDLFGIWEYPTFSVLLCFVCVYVLVKLVQRMVNML